MIINSVNNTGNNLSFNGYKADIAKRLPGMLITGAITTPLINPNLNNFRETLLWTGSIVLGGECSKLVINGAKKLFSKLINK